MWSVPLVIGIVLARPHRRSIVIGIDVIEFFLRQNVPTNERPVLPLESESHAVTAAPLLLPSLLFLLRLLLIFRITLLVDYRTTLSARPDDRLLRVRHKNGVFLIAVVIGCGNACGGLLGEALIGSLTDLEVLDVDIEEQSAR